MIIKLKTVNLTDITESLRQQSDEAFHRLDVRESVSLQGISLNTAAAQALESVGNTPVSSNNPSFNKAAGYILKSEGGFTIDSGGPTMRGITLSTYNRHASRLGLPKLIYNSRSQIKADMMKYVTKDVALNIYKNDYWDKSIAGPVFNAGFSKSAFVLFDIAVNGGIGRANSIYKQVLGNVPASGLSLTGRQDYNLAVDLENAMHAFRMALTVANPGKYAQYKTGWTRRHNQMLDWVRTF